MDLLLRHRMGQPDLSCFRISTGQVQPVKRRTGPGQRGIAGCLRGTEAPKKTLDFCKGRMLGKDDAFKVVLIQLLIPVRTSADSSGPARFSPYERTPEEPVPGRPLGIAPSKALA